MKIAIYDREQRDGDGGEGQSMRRNARVVYPQMMAIKSTVLNFCDIYITVM